MFSPSNGKGAFAQFGFASASAFCGLLVLICGLLWQDAWADDNPANGPNEKLLSIMNEVRTKAGLASLKPDKRIDEAAATAILQAWLDSRARRR